MTVENIKIVLASASPRRRDLLRQIGLEPEIIPCDLEERPHATAPDQVVQELSEQKACHVAKICGNGSRKHGSETYAVIGADTVVSVDGEILGKPEDEEEAAGMIRRLQGREHQVFTGVTMVFGERRITFSEETRVEVYPMTEQEILRYVARGESMDKAGAYGIQGSFAAFVKRLCGSYTNVMGLPAGRVYQELVRLMEEKND